MKNYETMRLFYTLKSLAIKIFEYVVFYYLQNIIRSEMKDTRIGSSVMTQFYQKLKKLKGLPH